MHKPARLVVLISGNGSNLQALIDASESGRMPAHIIGVISNRAGVYGLQRAEQHRIPTVVLERNGNRAEYDTALAGLVAGFDPDWVILAGWMRVLTMHFLHRFPDRVVNLHPALPGQFPGTHAIERAFVAAQRGEIDHTGVMIHLVPDEGVDVGPVLSTQVIPIQPDDTLDGLTGRIHTVEHVLLVDTIHKLIKGEIPSPAGSPAS